MITIEKFADKSALIDKLITVCQQQLSNAVAEHGDAFFAVSGGSSPQPAYEALSQSDLPWSAITVAMVDERWVDESHSASNQAFLKRTLLKDRAQVAKAIFMKTAAATPEAGLAEVAARYQAVRRGFDLTILGMGPDAHTASLFPNAQGLAPALDKASAAQVAVIHATPSAVTGEHTARVTLTLAEILRSKLIVLLINGEEKWQAFSQAQHSSDPMLTPVTAILQQCDTPILVFWAP